MDGIDGETTPTEGDDAAEGATADGGVNRRDLIKKTVIGAGVAGLVWSAPRIEGLSVRPDYAAAASGGGDSDPGQSFDRVILMDTLATSGAYSESDPSFPNLFFGYGWNTAGGPGNTDFSFSGSSDCAINADVQLFVDHAADAISDSPIQPGAPLPFTTYKHFQWTDIVPNQQGVIVVHFTC